MTLSVASMNLRDATLTAALVIPLSLIAGGKARAAGVFECKGPTQGAVITCCQRETQQRRPDWMMSSNLTCAQVTSCAGNRKDKERCRVIIPETQNPSHDNNNTGRQTFSDVRLKTNIHRIGTTVLNLPLYSFEYRGRPGLFIGVMAQDVLKVEPSAVSIGPGGYYRVDYGKLGIEMLRVQ